MKLSSIVFEGFRKSVSIIDGKKYSVDWLGTADTFGDFKKAIDRMPNTIESIDIPTNTTIFKTSADSKKIKPEGSWKSDVIITVGKVVKDHRDNGDELQGIRINSYFGIGPKGPDNDPIYISIETKESREFGDKMSRGDYGSLD
ncbi:hypothetical protein N8445_00145 [bacterium]|nr:hypothetical protein [bacterium]